MTPMVETPETPKQLFLANRDMASRGVSIALKWHWMRQDQTAPYGRKFDLDSPSKPGFSKHVGG